MKKILFCASALALMAIGCSEDVMDNYSGQDVTAKGITFEAALSETAGTRADLAYDDVSGIHNFFWYAEQDKISIWSTNTTAEGGDVANGNPAWDKSKKAEYKATQSKANGVFTAVDGDNILSFEYPFNEKYDYEKDAENKVSQFFAVYPTTAKVTGVSDGKFTIGTLPDLSAQDQATPDGQDVTANMLMYSLTKSHKVNSYDAVGEKIDLKFVRPFTAAVFSTKGYDAYAEYFGKIISITMEAGGSISPNPVVAASKLIYDNSDATFVFDSKTPAASKLTLGSDPVSEVELTFGETNGIEWADEYRAYMAIASVDRKAFRDKSAKETMLITYSFESIEFANVKIETNANWPGEYGNNKFIGVPALDIDSYPYLVTNVANSDDRALIVNKGKFSDIYEKAASGNVKWNGEDVSVAEFKTIISKVALTDAELKGLNAFENVTSLTLTENTALKADQIDDLVLTYLEMPKATSFGDGTFNENVALATVILPAYKFAENVTTDLLKKGSLEVLDMSSVTVMGNVFPASGFVLTGFESLTAVTVGEGLQLGSSSFQGCSALDEIKGGTVTVRGSSVFDGCTDLAKTAKGILTVKTNAGIIPAGAFKGCANLKKLMDGATGKQLVPTAVETSAFEGCAALESISLKNVMTLGAGAFKDCAKLTGIDEYSTKKVLWVGAEHISTSAFENCDKLSYVYFEKAKTIDNTILASSNGSRALREVKFEVPFTSKVAKNAKSNQTFGDKTDNVVLYVAVAQTGVDGKKLTLNESEESNNTVTFASIER